MSVISGSTLERLRWAAQGYGAVLNDNFQRLEDVYLKVSGMGDVDTTGLSDGDVLQWNGSLWVPVAPTFMTTTTTT